MYTNETRILILEELEKDIFWLCRQRSIPGFEREDLQQELRLAVWERSPKYNPHKASVRTWGVILMKGKLNKLYRDHCTTDKRKANVLREEFDETRDYEYEND